MDCRHTYRSNSYICKSLKKLGISVATKRGIGFLFRVLISINITRSNL